MGDFAEHEDDLKVEKSCVPSRILAPFLISLKSNLVLICQALFFSNDNDPSLFIILYSYVLSLAKYLELNFKLFLLISTTEIRYLLKKNLMNLGIFVYFLFLDLL